MYIDTLSNVNPKNTNFSDRSFHYIIA